MKRIILFYYICMGFMIYSCKEEPIGQQPIHHHIPGAVSDVKVENIPGGAIVSYQLPEDEDLLYVKASYYLKDGVKSEQRSSLYKDNLIIQGYGDTEPKEIEIVAVDRYRNESQPVKATIHPLTPPVWTIGETLSLVSDFGGVHAYWENELRAEVSVVILVKDHNDEYVPLETFYSSMTEGDGAVRGLEIEPGDFGVYVQDRWENRSEIKYYTLTPIFETLLDKNKFQAIDLPGDAGQVGNWEKHKMWDKEKGENGYSSPSGTGIMPQFFTIDLGVLAQLSRIRLYQRLGSGDEHIYAEGNVRFFKVYGSETLDMSGSMDSWTLLMECESIKPSDLPFGQKSNEDIDRAKNGEDFVNSPLNPRIRYLRIEVERTWSGGDNFQISELDIYGDDR